MLHTLVMSHHTRPGGIAKSTSFTSNGCDGTVHGSKSLKYHHTSSLPAHTSDSCRYLDDLNDQF